MGLPGSTAKPKRSLKSFGAGNQAPQPTAPDAGVSAARAEEGTLGEMLRLQRKSTWE
jgi:hypothetical protein